MGSDPIMLSVGGWIRSAGKTWLNNSPFERTNRSPTRSF